MRIVTLALALLFAYTAQAAQYPLGSEIEEKMKTFDPKKHDPGTYSFVKYMLELQEFHDVGLHFDDIEMMLFDLPIPPDPHATKAPQ